MRRQNETKKYDVSTKFVYNELFRPTGNSADFCLMTQYEINSQMSTATKTDDTRKLKCHRT